MGGQGNRRPVAHAQCGRAALAEGDLAAPCAWAAAARAQGTARKVLGAPARG